LTARLLQQQQQQQEQQQEQENSNVERRLASKEYKYFKIKAESLKARDKTACPLSF